MLILPVLLLCIALVLGIVYHMESLGSVVYSLHPPLLNTLQAGVQRNISVWLWDEAMLPILEAPSWTVPLVLGLLFLGIGVWRRTGG